MMLSRSSSLFSILLAVGLPFGFLSQAHSQASNANLPPVAAPTPSDPMAASNFPSLGSVPRSTPDQSNAPLPPNVEVFKVRTSSPENSEIPFYVKIPSSYDPSNQTAVGKVYRILLICPYFNEDALKVIKSDRLISVADKNGWFVVSPTFKQKGSETHDRKKSYYYPESFSGQAVLDALDQIKKKYPVDTNHLLLNGLSGGGQFVHRLALWIPDQVTAVAVNSCSWFDDPNKGAAKFPWLVTIGESDPAYEASIAFISKLKDAGALPIFKSYIGMIHEGDGRASELDANFLSFYDKLTAGNLGKNVSFIDRERKGMVLTPKEMPFVGDFQEWTFLTNTPENVEKIGEESRIYLPTDQIAKLWGKQENE